MKLRLVYIDKTIGIADFIAIKKPCKITIGEEEFWVTIQTKFKKKDKETTNYKGNIIQFYHRGDRSCLFLYKVVLQNKWKEFKWHFYSKKKKQRLRDIIQPELDLWDKVD